MVKTITESEFVEAFDDYDRSENFSIEARRGLFEYMEDMEESMGEPMELDVISVCCEWGEYESAVEACQDYVSEFDDSDPNDPDDELKAHEFLCERTSVIRLASGGVVIEAF